MRIAVFVSSLNGGGAERTMVTIANGLAARGHNVTLVAARAGGDLAHLLSQDVTPVILGARRTVAALGPLLRVLREQQAQALLSAMDVPNLVAVLASRIVRQRLLTFPTYHTPLSIAARDGGWIQRMRLPIARYVVKHAYQPVAVSKGVAEDLRTVAPRIGTFSTIYNPVIDEESFLQDALAPINESILPAGDGPLVLSVGRLAREKDHGTLVEAFQLFREQFPTARLLILGRGPLEDVIRRQVNAAGLDGAVSMPGFVLNPRPYMTRCDVFVLTSTREGFGNVLVEAGACGAPLVATDCPTGPAEILAGRPRAFLAPMRDAHAVATAMVSASYEGRLEPTLEGWGSFTGKASVDGYETICTVPGAVVLPQ